MEAVDLMGESCVSWPLHELRCESPAYLLLSASAVPILPTIFPTFPSRLLSRFIHPSSLVCFSSSVHFYLNPQSDTGSTNLAANSGTEMWGYPNVAAG